MENFTANTDIHGGHAVAVPGEIKGLWELHRLYGLAEWRSLFEPSVKLARGMVMGKDLYDVSFPSQVLQRSDGSFWLENAQPPPLLTASSARTRSSRGPSLVTAS